MTRPHHHYPTRSDRRPLNQTTRPRQNTKQKDQEQTSQKKTVCSRMQSEKGDTHVYQQRLVLLLIQPSRLALHQLFIHLGLALQRRPGGFDRHLAHFFELYVARRSTMYTLVRSGPYSWFLEHEVNIGPSATSTYSPQITLMRWVRTLSGRVRPSPGTYLEPPAAFVLANSSDFFTSSALRSKKEETLTPAAFALSVGGIESSFWVS